MKLVLDIVKSGRIVPEKKKFHFDENDGTIGRNDDCDWILKDQNSYISGQHAKIVNKHGTFFIIDESTNGTYLKNPYKRLPKGHPFKISPSDVFIVGDHELQARFSHNDYSEDDIIGGFEEKPTMEQIIPNDDFLMEDQIEESVEGNEIIDVLDKPLENHTDTLFIDVELDDDNQEKGIDSFLNLDNEQEVQEDISIEISDGFTQEHIQMSSYSHQQQKEFEDPRPVAQTRPSSGLAASVNILESKLGIKIASLEQEERDMLMEELGEIVLSSLDYLKNSINIKEKTKQDLHISSNYMDTKDNNPIRLGSKALKIMQTNSNDGLLGMMKISDALKSSFKEVDAHCISLHSATKNIMKVAMSKFSPKNLEYRFESTGQLRGVLPKAQLMWKAYENMFHRLNDRPEEGVEIIKEDFTKEYESTLYSLNLHTNELKDR